MMTTITSTQLSYLTREISAGRPFWALLRLNEWRTSSDPLGQALAARCLKFLSGPAYEGVRDIVEALAAGARLTELNPADQLRTRAVREQTRVVSREIPHIPSFRTRIERTAVRRDRREICM